MNAPFKGVSAARWFDDDHGGSFRPVAEPGETTKMLAIMVLGAVVLAFALEAAVVAFGPEEF